MFDKKKQKKLHKIARKTNELYELIKENNDILNIDARIKLKSALDGMETSICKECEYSRTCGKKEYWRNIWRKITGKKN